MLKIPFFTIQDDDDLEREASIVRTSIVGVVTNLGLAGVKGIVGVATNSVAVTLDAINNLSDAVSSGVTFVGTKLSSHPPTKKHPFGFGRIEYMTALIVAIIILYAGVSAMLESVDRIIEPSDPDFSTVSLVIIALAVVVKIILGRYMIVKGRKNNSSALSASGKDSLFDAILSFSVLVAAIIFVFTEVSIEAYVGILISLFIIKTGIEIMVDSLGDMFGRRSDSDITRNIKEIIREQPGVNGAYDLIINNYGPGRDYASIHVEVDSSMSADDIDLLSRSIQAKVMDETGVVLTAIGVYSADNSDPESVAMRERIAEKVLSHEWALEMHGFRLDREKMIVRFDVVLSFDIDRGEALEILVSEVSELYPDYRAAIVLDVDLTD